MNLCTEIIFTLENFIYFFCLWPTSNDTWELLMAQGLGLTPVGLVVELGFPIIESCSDLWPLSWHASISRPLSFYFSQWTKAVSFYWVLCGRLFIDVLFDYPAFFFLLCVLIIIGDLGLSSHHLLFYKPFLNLSFHSLLSMQWAEPYHETVDP